MKQNIEIPIKIEHYSPNDFVEDFQRFLQEKQLAYTEQLHLKQAESDVRGIQEVLYLIAEHGKTVLDVLTLFVQGINWMKNKKRRALEDLQNENELLKARIENRKLKKELEMLESIKTVTIQRKNGDDVVLDLGEIKNNVQLKDLSAEDIKSLFWG